MSKEGEKATDLVPSTSSALSRVGSKSLVQRGMQDWLAAEDAEQCFKKGWDLLHQSRQEEAALTIASTVMLRQMTRSEWSLSGTSISLCR